jgi:hypothetical protein
MTPQSTLAKDRIMRPAHALLALSVVLLASAGCRSLHIPEPVPIVVRDAETNAPISGAEVRIWDPAVHDTGDLHDASATTGANGIARVRTAAPQGNEVLVQVCAAGYLAGQANLPAEDAVPTPGSLNRMPAGTTVDVFAGPRPTLELNVPMGYRGLVKVEVRVAADGPAQPGQRQFRFAVSPSGVAQVVGPKVLGQLTAQDISASYADGTPIRREVPDNEIGFRWVRCEGATQFFAVGTLADCEDFRREAERMQPSQRSGPGGNGNGGRGGGRGHRGGGGGGGGMMGASRPPDSGGS